MIAPRARSLRALQSPLAITMWDFSWLERRGPDGEYRDWDAALLGLRERGYDAVRIDAYPHLVADASRRRHRLLPAWTVERWGSAKPIDVTVLPDLLAFLEACARHGIRVALSSWFREDDTGARLRITSPTELARIWRVTLEHVRRAGLSETLLYVDLCNEFPLEMWAPFVSRQEVADDIAGGRKAGDRWMRESIASLRGAVPDLSLTFSFDAEEDPWQGQDVSHLDLLELHIWMAQWSSFYADIDYVWDLFGEGGYDALAARGEATYRASPERWLGRLREAIGVAAAWSRQLDRPLVTTECWGVINYRDDPRLDWGWVKEQCEVGVLDALATGRWVALATSNFCGPQFRGMWQDAAWHRRLTDRIHAGSHAWVAAA